MGRNGKSGPSVATNQPNDLVNRYLDNLDTRRKAIDEVREEPPTPPGSPSHQGPSEDRAEAVRERALEAWRNANGNPADGKWIFLTQMLKLHATSGREGRWMNTRTDIPMAKPIGNSRPYWINARTEAEWRSWEARDSEERKIWEKVENWQKKLDAQQTLGSNVPDSTPAQVSVASTSALKPPPATPASPQKQSPKSARRKIATMKTAGAVPKGVVKTPSSSDPLKDKSPFGFSVVKRPAVQKSALGKPANKADLSQSGPSQQVRPHTSSQDKIPNIADVTDMSFLPPSFPSSVIHTSTPKPKSKSTAKSSTARKPDTIPQDAPNTSFNPEPVSVPFPPSLQSQTSPHAAKPHKRLNDGVQTFSLPAIPFPSTSPPHIQDMFTTDTSNPSNNEINANNKRPALPVTPHHDEESSRVLKKARTLPSLPVSPGKYRQDQLMGPPSPFITKDILPHASSVVPAAPAPAVITSVDSSSSSQPVTPKKQAVPTLRELLASRKKNRTKTNTSSPGFIIRAQLASASRRVETGSEVPSTDRVAEQVKQAHITPNPDPPILKSPALDSARPFDPVPAAPVPRCPSPVAPVLEPFTAEKTGVIPSPEPHAAEKDVGADIPTTTIPEPNHGGDPVQELSIDAFPELEHDVEPVKAAPVLDPYADDADFDAIMAAPPAAKDSQDAYRMAFDPYLDYPADSPTKSLSSIADSDSEDPSDDEAKGPGAINLSFDFQPPITSTQGGPRAGKALEQADSWASVYGPTSVDKAAPQPPTSSAGIPGYNSQFEATVARRVDEVDQLLERDTVYDGWLRDPSPEPTRPAMAMDDSP